MQIGDTKSFKKAMIVFFIAVAGLQLVYFGSFYLGRYGFSLTPLIQGQAGLWWRFYQEAGMAAGGAMAVAVPVYLVARRKQDEESKTATEQVAGASRR
jgi:hypothetical protein